MRHARHYAFEFDADGPLEEEGVHRLFLDNSNSCLKSQAWKLLTSLHSCSADFPLIEVLNDRCSCTSATSPLHSTCRMSSIYCVPDLLPRMTVCRHERKNVGVDPLADSQAHAQHLHASRLVTPSTAQTFVENTVVPSAESVA